MTFIETPIAEFSILRYPLASPKLLSKADYPFHLLR
jgi:hypothetical protein